MLKKIMLLTLSICAVTLLAIFQPANAQISEFKITASDGAAVDLFGHSVSISGDYAVVGASGDDDNGTDAGSAYIFKRTGTSWVEEAKLLASDGAAGDWFGHSVSISGDYAVVGARRDDDNGTESGSAYVFKRTGTSWVQEAKLLPSDGAAGDRFGVSVSISGDYVVVGAWLDDDNGTDSGSAYVFKRTGTSWAQEAKLLALDGAAFDNFGSSISIYGDHVVVGTVGDNDNGIRSGSAYVFKRTSTSWAEEAKLLASDGAAEDWFGWIVSISGNYAVVGARLDGDNGIRSGSAYVFKRTSTSWAEEAKLLASDGAADDQFGVSVSISGDYAVVGAFFHDDNGDSSGSAYLFRRTGTSWVEEVKLLASDGAAGDNFGSSVSISGDYTVVAARFDDDNFISSGSAYVYNGFTDPSPIIAKIIDVPHDQGGWVTVEWTASSRDTNVSTLPYYSIWRALPVGTVLANSAMSAADMTADFAGEAYRIESFGGRDLAFEWIANQPAHRLAMYSYTAQTLFDSSSATFGKHYFMLSAHTNDPDVFFDSQIDSGYSVDNLAPLPPTNLAGILDPNAEVVELHWNPSSEEDLSHYLLYRSTSPDINPDVAEPIATIEDTLFVDSDLPLSNEWYYTLVAEDIHENRSDKSNEISILIVGVDGETGAVPESFRLSQNYPNPFNPETMIEYALPLRSDVKLTIYNLRGEEVALLINGTVPAGTHRISWDASSFASGVYLYRLQAGDFVQTRKMLLLK
ncbi:MAG: T9SS type A sorting domain-containing protein [Candidatus Marinimicrobia bacterium]|nr:T9SS type A sorting domain-containing protein [Candidatus Neomarinimicrobiota bacterium]